MIARSGTRLLIFDDVEDEFAIGVAEKDGVLREWSLYGDLIDALRCFLSVKGAERDMRRGEILALEGRDVDWQQKTLNIRKSIWHQELGPVKTEESEKVLPLDDEMLADLARWRRQTPYARDEDWIFASSRMHGKQPL